MRKWTGSLLRLNSNLPKSNSSCLSLKSVKLSLRAEIKAQNERLSGDIKTLNATVAGIGKRIDNAEFFNRGVAVAKWFGWLPTN
jgi:hypothetical protein